MIPTDYAPIAYLVAKKRVSKDSKDPDFDPEDHFKHSVTQYF